MTDFEREELEQLKKKTEAFTNDVFDWVSTLGEVGLLQRLYDFKTAIDNKLGEK